MKLYKKERCIHWSNFELPLLLPLSTRTARKCLFSLKKYYPSNYHYTTDDFDHNNLNCTWVITAEDPDLVIYLNKWPKFDIEYSQTCTWDYIEVFDGPDTTSSSMGRYCGKQAPYIVRSTGRSLTLSYITDELVPS